VDVGDDVRVSDCVTVNDGVFDRLIVFVGVNDWLRETLLDAVAAIVSEADRVRVGVLVEVRVSVGVSVSLAVNVAVGEPEGDTLRAIDAECDAVVEALTTTDVDGVSEGVFD
jgi:hypothetical protein